MRLWVCREREPPTAEIKVTFEYKMLGELMKKYMLRSGGCAGIGEPERSKDEAIMLGAGFI